jgi:hypothetical protein
VIETKRKIERYLRQLAPHQKDREGPMLLREALAVIGRLDEGPTIPAGWQQATHANAPKYGERVIVLTTDADGDPTPEFAHYNGRLGYLGVGGKRIKPVLFCSIPQRR